jgi:hypothetical protein
MLNNEPNNLLMVDDDGNVNVDRWCGSVLVLVFLKFLTAQRFASLFISFVNSKFRAVGRSDLSLSSRHTCIASSCWETERSEEDGPRARGPRRKYVRHIGIKRSVSIAENTVMPK